MSMTTTIEEPSNRRARRVGSLTIMQRIPLMSEDVVAPDGLDHEDSHEATSAERQQQQQEEEEEAEEEEEEADTEEGISLVNNIHTNNNGDDDDDCTTTLTTTSNTVRCMADNLMDLLRNVKSQNVHCYCIDLERKRLPATYLRALLKHCIGNPCIRRIRLYKVGVADGHAPLIAELLKHADCGLVDLDLGKNDLGTSGLFTIAHQISACRSLRRLVLTGNYFTSSPALSVLFQAVRQSNIESLKLSKIQMNEQCASNAFWQLLMDDSAALSRLDLRNCGMHQHIGTIAKALAQKSSSSSSSSSSGTGGRLVALSLAENELQDAHLEQIVNALRCNDTIQVLDLQANHSLTDASINLLIDCLRNDNHTLQKLKLRNCQSVSNNLKEEMLDLLLMNGHGRELASRTKLAERCIMQRIHHQQLLPDLTETSRNDDDDDETETTSEVSSSSLSSSSLPGDNATIETDCAICFEPNHPSSVTLLPCGHKNCCPECAVKLSVCHMCRETVVKVFSTKMYHERQIQRWLV